MATSADDDIELPEFTQEHIDALKTPAAPEPLVDLHLGPAVVQPVDNWWIKQYGPRPPSLLSRSLDVIIALLAVYTIWLIIRVWWWILVN